MSEGPSAPETRVLGPSRRNDATSALMLLSGVSSPGPTVLNRNACRATIHIWHAMEFTSGLILNHARLHWSAGRPLRRSSTVPVPWQAHISMELFDRPVDASIIGAESCDTVMFDTAGSTS